MLILECDAEVGREIGGKAGEYFHSWRHIVLKVHIAVLKCAFTSGLANIPCGTFVTPHHSSPRGSPWSAVALQFSPLSSPPQHLPLAPPPRRPRATFVKQTLAAVSASLADAAA